MREEDHSLPSGTEVKNACNYKNIFTDSYILIMMMMMLCYEKGQLLFACDKGGGEWSQLHALYEAMFVGQEFKMHCKIMDLRYHT